MDAKTLKKKSFDAISPELEKIEKQLDAAAAKGELRYEVGKISDAARIYFKEKGFEVKAMLREGSTADSPLWVITW